MQKMHLLVKYWTDEVLNCWFGEFCFYRAKQLC